MGKDNPSGNSGILRKGVTFASEDECLLSKLMISMLADKVRISAEP
jgi:hypothetical protein